MWLAGIFNMLTYTAATSYVADIFLRRVRVRFRVTVYTQLAVGVYWDSTPLTASAEIFKVYIYQFYAIYMWLHFDIYIDVLCVPAYWSRDGTETQRLDSFWVGSLHWASSYFHLIEIPFLFLKLGNWNVKKEIKSIRNKEFLYTKIIRKIKYRWWAFFHGKNKNFRKNYFHEIA